MSYTPETQSIIDENREFFDEVIASECMANYVEGIDAMDEVMHAAFELYEAEYASRSGEIDDFAAASTVTQQTGLATSAERPIAHPVTDSFALLDPLTPAVIEYPVAKKLLGTDEIIKLRPHLWVTKR